MSCQLHNFATRPTLIRSAIDAWRPWIEAKLGVRLDDAVIIETRHNVAQIGVEAVLGVEHNRAGSSKVTRRLKTFLASAEVPPTLPPLLGYSKSPSQLRFSGIFERGALRIAQVVEDGAGGADGGRAAGQAAAIQ